MEKLVSKVDMRPSGVTSEGTYTTTTVTRYYPGPDGPPGSSHSEMWRPRYLPNGGWVMELVPHNEVLNPYRYARRDFNAKLSIVDYVYYSRSQGGSPPSEGSPEMIEAAITAAKPTMKKPKKPVFYPLKFHGKEPVFKPFDESRLPLPKQPAGMSDQKWGPRLNLYLDRRLQLIRKINERRSCKYERRRRAYDLRYANFQARVIEHKKIFEHRMLKYEIRLDRYNKQSERSLAHSLSRIRAKRPYSEFRPYEKLQLWNRDANPAPVIGAWVSDGDPTFRHWCWVATGVMNHDVSLSETNRRDIASGMYRQILNATASQFLEMEPLAVRKLYDKLADQQVHIGNLIAERKQTFDMICSIWMRIYDLVKLKRGLLKKVVTFVRNPKAWAGEVLQFKFGVEPLANDLQALMDKILEPADEKPYVRASARAKRNDLIIHTPNFSFEGYASLRYVVQYEMMSDIDRYANQWGLLDLKQVLWEITPWSFVTDWFIPIGAWIASQNATSGMQYKQGVRVLTLKGEFRFSGASQEALESITPGSGIHGQLTPCSVPGVFSGTWKHRELISEPPDRSRILEFKNPFSISHAVETIALLIQKLHR